MSIGIIERTRAVPGTLTAMHRHVTSKRGGTVDREALSDELLPPVLRSARDPLAPVNETLLLGVDLALWVIEDGRVIASETSRKLEGDALSSFVAARVFRAGTEGSDRNFLEIIAWILAQPDPLGEALTPKVAESRVSEQSKGGGFRLNETRFAQAIHWAQWLGAVRSVPRAGLAVRGDPTVAVSRALSQFLEPGARVPVAMFLDRLADELPFIDGGRMRKEVEAACPELAGEDGRVSASLSLALLRLDEAGDVRLSAPSDADGVLLKIEDESYKVAYVQRGDAS